jgi:hypothetical protein
MRVVPPGLMLMVEPVVFQVRKAAWVAMVESEPLLGKAAREGLMAKAVVIKRASRTRVREQWI